LVIVLSGPGGVGKGTIAQRLVRDDPYLWLSRSWTTRARRPGEAEDAYHFVDRARFLAHIDAGGFLEWAEFHGNYYGTPWPEAPEGYDVLLEIDVQGAAAVVEQQPDAVLVFVDAPTREHQAERLRGRGDDDDAVLRRMAEGERERAAAEELGYSWVINDDIDRAVVEILDLIDAHRRR
jgi:guanylate kinase